MEYISHNDFKSLMNKLQAGTPKSVLKESLNQEGNAFTGGLAKTKKGGEFKVGHTKVKDTSNYDAPMKEYQFDDMYPDDPGPFEGMEEEGLNFPTGQATGPTIQTVEEDGISNPPMGFSVLSPDERKQLREYINSYKTIKTEISKLLEKAGKDNSIMENDGAGYTKGSPIVNKKKAHDQKVPAESKPHYQEPTKKSKAGGDRTGLVLKKGEMWEIESAEMDVDPRHEEIEQKLDAKIHDAFHKVTQMAIKSLVANGVSEQEAMMFLKQEMEEKGEEEKMDQYSPF